MEGGASAVTHAYVSRKTLQYNDDASQNSEDEDEGAGYAETSGMARLNTLGVNVKVKANPRFKNYANLFNNLTKHQTVATMYPIVSVSITYDSTRAITVTKKDDQEFWVRMYDLETYDKTFDM